MSNLSQNSSNKSDSKIRIMLVDDSAVVRGMMTKILSEEPDFEIVESCINGQQALDCVTKAQPDLILLDVEMPIMDGMAALPQLVKLVPDARIVMCSTLTVRNASITLDALRKGATECIAKPTSPQDISKGGEFQQNLVNIIRGLGRSRVRPTVTNSSGAASASTAQVKNVSSAKSSFQLNTNPALYKGKPSLIAIGSSTGGPQALFDVVSHFKDFQIPIIITQHMPATFTKILAQHISNHTGVTAVEGEDGMRLEKGIVYVAPGGKHMLLNKDETGSFIIKLDDGAPVNFCKPAVDPMLLSAEKLFGNKILTVILTGMGHDGLAGARSLAEKGGQVIAQDEETSVVWGMPGAVAMAGICSKVLPLKQVGPWVRKAVTGI